MMSLTMPLVLTVAKCAVPAANIAGLRQGLPRRWHPHPPLLRPWTRKPRHPRHPPQKHHQRRGCQRLYQRMNPRLRQFPRLRRPLLLLNHPRNSLCQLGWRQNVAMMSVRLNPHFQVLLKCAVDPLKPLQLTWNPLCRVADYWTMRLRRAVLPMNHRLKPADILPRYG